MSPDHATSAVVLTALKDIRDALYACRECGAYVDDDSTVAADSAADFVQVCAEVFSNHDLTPDFEPCHASDCESNAPWCEDCRRPLRECPAECDAQGLLR